MLKPTYPNEGDLMAEIPRGNRSSSAQIGADTGCVFGKGS